MEDQFRLGGFRRVSVDTPDEQEAAAGLSRRLELLESVMQRWGRVASAKAQERSELRTDDARTGFLRASHTVSHGIGTALDCLRSFQDLVRPNGEFLFPQIAHYSLLRSALEAGSMALWIIYPDDPRERINRLVRTSARELHEENDLSHQMIRDMQSDPDLAMTGSDANKAIRQRREHWRHVHHEIRRIARSLGLDDPIDERRVGFAEIVRSATEATGAKGYFGETTWRMISGLAHPSLMRSTTRSHIEEVADNGDGTFHALVTTDIGLTRTGFDMAFINTLTAIELVAQRKLRPARPEEYRSN